jgi:hypothetical protein
MRDESCPERSKSAPNKQPNQRKRSYNELSPTSDNESDADDEDSSGPYLKRRKVEAVSPISRPIASKSRQAGDTDDNPFLDKPTTTSTKPHKQQRPRYSLPPKEPREGSDEADYAPSSSDNDDEPRPNTATKVVSAARSAIAFRREHGITVDNDVQFDWHESMRRIREKEREELIQKLQRDEELAEERRKAQRLAREARRANTPSSESNVFRIPPRPSSLSKDEWTNILAKSKLVGPAVQKRDKWLAKQGISPKSGAGLDSPEEVLSAEHRGRRKTRSRTRSATHSEGESSVLRNKRAQFATPPPEAHRRRPDERTKRPSTPHPHRSGNSTDPSSDYSSEDMELDRVLMSGPSSPPLTPPRLITPPSRLRTVAPQHSADSSASEAGPSVPRTPSNAGPSTQTLNKAEPSWRLPMSIKSMKDKRTYPVSPPREPTPLRASPRTMRRFLRDMEICQREQAQRQAMENHTRAHFLEATGQVRPQSETQPLIILPEALQPGQSVPLTTAHLSQRLGDMLKATQETQLPVTAPSSSALAPAALIVPHLRTPRRTDSSPVTPATLPSPSIVDPFIPAQEFTSTPPVQVDTEAYNEEYEDSVSVEQLLSPGHSSMPQGDGDPTELSEVAPWAVEPGAMTQKEALPVTVAIETKKVPRSSELQGKGRTDGQQNSSFSSR